jgi:hypothetical protein
MGRQHLKVKLSNGNTPRIRWFGGRFIVDRGGYTITIDIGSPSPGDTFQRDTMTQTVTISNAKVTINPSAGALVIAAITDGTNSWGPTSQSGPDGAGVWTFNWSNVLIPAGDYLIRIEAQALSDDASQSIPIGIS